MVGRLDSLLGDSHIDQLLGGLEGVGDSILAGFPDGVVQPFGEQRLGFLGFLGRVAHPVEDLVEPLSLLLDTLPDLLALIGVSE